jgi:hypothetical protein
LSACNSAASAVSAHDIGCSTQHELLRLEGFAGSIRRLHVSLVGAWKMRPSSSAKEIGVYNSASINKGFLNPQNTIV